MTQDKGYPCSSMRRQPSEGTGDQVVSMLDAFTKKRPAPDGVRAQDMPSAIAPKVKADDGQANP